MNSQIIHKDCKTVIDEEGKHRELKESMGMIKC